MKYNALGLGVMRKKPQHTAHGRPSTVQEEETWMYTTARVHADEGKVNIGRETK